MGYTKYEELMNIKTENPPGVTRKEYSWNDGPGKDGYATLYLKDDVPVAIKWYDWNLDQDFMLNEIGKSISKKLKATVAFGGNGHYTASIELTNDT